MVDKAAIIHFVIKNESAHDIKIQFDFLDQYYTIPDNVELHKGTTKSLMGSTGEGGTVIYPYICEARITFDEDIEIIHRPTSEYHSICNEHDCKIEKKNQYEGTFTFTFTDADYEYALSQQTVE